MPRPSLPRSEYEKLGKELDLELIGTSPATTLMNAKWKCKRCGKTVNKRYKHLKYKHLKPCTCR